MPKCEPRARLGDWAKVVPGKIVRHTFSKAAAGSLRNPHLRQNERVVERRLF
jgi:hypothetical protein